LHGALDQRFALDEGQRRSDARPFGGTIEQRIDLVLASERYLASDFEGVGVIDGEGFGHDAEMIPELPCAHKQTFANAGRGRASLLTAPPRRCPPRAPRCARVLGAEAEVVRVPAPSPRGR